MEVDIHSNQKVYNNLMLHLVHQITLCYEHVPIQLKSHHHLLN